jgi:tRNA-Thr(GGU) m(6)t(6)A37 methyltransferase TsaA
MTDDELVLRPVGRVESSLVDPADAPPQGDEGAPDAWLVIDAAYAPAMRTLVVGQHIVVVTWLHRGDRNTLETRPRSDPDRPLNGVFSTRSPHRPNPIGLHVVEILEITGTKIGVRGLEAVDDTPVLDIKPVLEPRGQR